MLRARPELQDLNSERSSFLSNGPRATAALLLLQTRNKFGVWVLVPLPFPFRERVIFLFFSPREGEVTIARQWTIEATSIPPQSMSGEARQAGHHQQRCLAKLATCAHFRLDRRLVHLLVHMIKKASRPLSDRTR